MTFQAELTPIASLRPHPRNYRTHPDDQLDHIGRSIELHGFYRNVVAARDGTILAGHGVVEAARRIGRDEVPVIRLDLEPDDPRALHLLAGDNEVGRLAETDDRVLSELLSELADDDLVSLLGTGFDQESLAQLLILANDNVTSDDAMELWRGMPSFSTGFDRLRVTVKFGTEEDRASFAAQLGVPVDSLKTPYFWWPPGSAPRDDSRAVAYDDA